MKLLKVFAVTLLLCVVCNFTTFAEYQSVTERYTHMGVIDCPKYCNIRQSPTSKSKVVGLIPDGGGVEVLSVGDEWLAVRSGNINGYVMRRYVLTGDSAVEKAERIATTKVEFVGQGKVYSEPTVNSKVWESSTSGTVYNVSDVSEEWIQIDLDGAAGYIVNNDTVQCFYGLECAMPTYDVSAYSTKRQEIVKYAMQFLGNEYVWGGNDPHTGADCSGFVKYVYSHTAGITLPRVSYEQCYSGERISSLDMRPGDLIFYADSSGTVGHVAMYIGNSTIIHAASRTQGIKLSQWNYRTPKYIRRILDD